MDVNSWNYPQNERRNPRSMPQISNNAKVLPVIELAASPFLQQIISSSHIHPNVSVRSSLIDRRHHVFVRRVSGFLEIEDRQNVVLISVRKSCTGELGCNARACVPFIKCCIGLEVGTG